MDIFFTQGFQYVLEEDISSFAGRLVEFLSRSGGTLLAENSFRVGHPLGGSLFSGGRLAYLSGSFDPMAPKILPPPSTGEAAVHQPRTLVDIRIRPNFLLVVIAYIASVILLMDLLGFELFWKNQYLLRLGLLVAIAAVDVWAIFFVTARMKKKFESHVG
jgi:hypothetical protein